MARHLNLLKKATLLYWFGVWVTIAVVMLHKNINGSGFGLVLPPLIYCFALSGAIIFGVYHLLTFIFHRYSKKILSLAWFILPLFIILIVMEGMFRVISAHIYGIDSIRRETMQLLTISLIWSILAYFFFLRNMLKAG
jgi:hypothetical protein